MCVRVGAFFYVFIAIFLTCHLDLVCVFAFFLFTISFYQSLLFYDAFCALLFTCVCVCAEMHLPAESRNFRDYAASNG